MLIILALPTLIPVLPPESATLIGLVYVLLYGTMITAIRYKGYSPISQVPSELTAIGAPTRPLWMSLGTVYDVLVVAFGVSVWISGNKKNGLCVSLILFVFGAFTGLDSPRLQANLPTPWIGLWERINIYGFLLWVVVLAIALWRVQGTMATAMSQAST